MADVILCGIDDTDEARRAATVAGRLSGRLGVRLVLVHVKTLNPIAMATDPAEQIVPAPAPMLPYTPSTDDEDLDRHRQAGIDLVERVARELQLSGAEARVELAADTAEALRNVATEVGATMLVVGSRGRGSVSAALLGSTSSALAGDAPCPVLVVPPESS